MSQDYNNWDYNKEEYNKLVEVFKEETSELLSELESSLLELEKDALERGRDLGDLQGLSFHQRLGGDVRVRQYIPFYPRDRDGLRPRQEREDHPGQVAY